MSSDSNRPATHPAPDNADLIAFLDASPSPWHAVESTVARLDGFTQLYETDTAQNVLQGASLSAGNSLAAHPSTQPQTGTAASQYQEAAQTASAAEPGALQPGMRVEHAFFGQGLVSRLPGPRRVEILFDRHGSKILHLDYARLTPLP